MLTVAWGLVRVLAVVVAALWLGGVIDWAVDREQDTPYALRVGIAVVQSLAILAAIFFFLLKPLFRRLPDDDLSLWVEDKHPVLRHRLISTVQLNRPSAVLAGMSTELIAIVTRETEVVCESLRFVEVADHRRSSWCVKLLIPTLLVALLPFTLFPGLASSLLARQALLNVEIPHRVDIEHASITVWPAGEKLQLLYRVTGDVDDGWEGEVVVTPDGYPTDRYPLRFLKRTPEGAALFVADIQSSSVDLTHRAKLYDGRTRNSARLRFVPRPTIAQQEAWLLLPAFCGLRPDGQRYELAQSRGDVVGITGSAVRVRISTHAPITEAKLELLGYAQAPTSDQEEVPEIVLRTLNMAIGADHGNWAEVSFDMTDNLSAYRIHVWDEHGFNNQPAPRRTVRLVPEEAPQIALLKDDFGGGIGIDFEGMPVREGFSIRVPYVAQGNYGLGRAFLHYRILKKRESGNDDVEEESFIKLPLVELAAGKDTGPFDPKRGIFQNQGEEDELPFHAVPSPDPSKILGRTLGGGRVFLKTKGLINMQGKTVKLQSGDRVEYCVEVFADKDSDAKRPSSKSETRVSTIVNELEFIAWLDNLTREQERLRNLESQQRTLFERK